jgi:DNA ligase-1
MNLLETTSGRNDKIEILRDNATNTLLQDAIYHALSPYIQYNIRKIPKYTATGTKDVAWFISHLDQFSERKVTGNAAIQLLTELLSSMDPDSAIVAERIIKKDLRCGVQESTVNKVWKGLVPNYPCLLGKGYDEKTIQKIQWPAHSQLKADGMRVNVIYRIDEGSGESITIRGRSGKLVDLYGYFDDDFIDLGNTVGSSVVFDGELVVLDDDGSVMSRKKGNGILNKAVRGTISKEEASRVRMRVWDMIDYDAFLEFKDVTPYRTRFADLKEAISTCPTTTASALKDTIRYELIQWRIVQSLDEALAHYEEALAAGEEGIMLKNIDSPWEDKRSQHLVKMKAENDCDLEVIGWNPGTPGTKNENKMGSLVCASSDRMLEVSISGFSDDLRDEITANINDWIGRIVTVLYNERITSKDKSRQGVDSLFLPRFVELREDKEEADHSSKIK